MDIRIGCKPHRQHRQPGDAQHPPPAPFLFSPLRPFPVRPFALLYRHRILEDFGKNDRDIVRPARLIRSVDKQVHRHPRIALRDPQDVRQFRIGQHPTQSVAANQQHIVFSDPHLRHIGIGFDGHIPKTLHHDIVLGMIKSLFHRYLTLINKRLYVGMVLAHLPQPALGVPGVAPAVPAPSHIGLSIHDPADDQRRTHPLRFRVAPRMIDNGPVRIQYRISQDGARSPRLHRRRAQRIEIFLHTVHRYL